MATLRLFYKLNGVSWVSTQVSAFLSPLKIPELETERIKFANLLATIISANKPVLYLDETTCNSGMQVKKTWSNRGYRPKVYKVMTRYNCTIYACISATLLEKPVFLLTKKCTNTVNYLEFLKSII